MLWIIMVIATVIGCLAFITFVGSLTFFYGNIKMLVTSSLTFVGTSLVAFLCSATLEAIAEYTYTEREESMRYELVAFADGSEISGNGSGNIFYVHANISKNDIYTFYYKIDDNGYKKGHLDSKNTVIYEFENDDNPHIITYTIHVKNKMNRGLRHFLAFGWGEYDKSEYDQTEYEIFVPNGTILNLDLE